MRIGLYRALLTWFDEQALELLAVLMVDGPEGYRAVLAAMDYFKLVKGERVRFYSLLDALMTDEADLAFKRDVMLFINTLVNRYLTFRVRETIPIVKMTSPMIWMDRVGGIMSTHYRFSNMERTREPGPQFRSRLRTDF